jgi:UDP-N-acetylmuramoyl-tripeptide--D-alanyl-D-alanine ligase
MRCELSIPLTLKEIATAVSGSMLCDDAVIKNITTDTRELLPGDLYVPIKGSYFDGNDFCEFASVKGAYVISTKQSIADICIAQTDGILLALAKYYKKLLNVRHTICITGSVGKTTTKDICAAILRKKYKTHATKKNYNNQIGVPFTVLSTPRDCEVLVIEIGMNHSGEIASLSSSVTPTIAVITKIGSAHIGNLGSRKAIADEKSCIVTGNPSAKCIVPHGERLLDKITNRKTVSTLCSDADCYLEVSRRGFGGAYFDYKSELIEIFDGFIPNNAEHFPECTALAIAACEELGVNEKHIFPALSESVFNSRISVIGNLSLIDDAYNSSPESVFAAIKTLSLYKRPRGILLGDMLELGDLSAKLHQSIGSAVAKSKIDYLYAYGDFCDEIKRGAISSGMKAVRIFVNKSILSPETTAKQIADNQREGHLLFKASHKINLNNVIDILKILMG